MVRARRLGAVKQVLEVFSAPEFLASLEWMDGQAKAAGRRVHLAALVELPDGHSDAQSLAGWIQKASWQMAAFPHLQLDLWLQIPDDGTRFLNTTTASQFAPRLTWLLQEREKLAQDQRFGIGLDVEPNQRWLSALWQVPHPHRHRAWLRRSFVPTVSGLLRHARHRGSGHVAFQNVFSLLQQEKVPLHTATVPAFGGSDFSRAFREWFMGIPEMGSQAIPWLGVNAPMFYLPMLRHLFGQRSRSREHRQLLRWVKTHQTQRQRGVQPGPAAAVLGPTSHGVLGTEPVYELLDDLRTDLGMLVDLGYEDIGFFSLEGFLWGKRGLPMQGTLAPTRPDWRRWIRTALATGRTLPGEK
jgi:hypothetical protein